MSFLMHGSAMCYRLQPVPIEIITSLVLASKLIQDRFWYFRIVQGFHIFQARFFELVHLHDLIFKVFCSYCVSA